MIKQCLKVGITGGIGSGKTTVCRIFEMLGVPVYYADERAKKLMVEDPEIIRHVKKTFGEDAYLKNGLLNRSFIASQAFSDPEKLKILNAAVHPAVFRDSESWHASHRSVPYTIKEAALLIESGSYQALDKLILVTAPEEIRIRRVVQRDHVSAAAVRERMNHQMPESDKRKFADFFIDNTGDQSLLKQVWALHRQLRALST